VWTAALAVEFDMEDGQPQGLARTVLMRQAAQFQNDIERGAGIARTRVKRDSARVDIASQEAMEQPLQALDVHSPMFAGQTVD
jgi:hypothetical protein